MYRPPDTDEMKLLRDQTAGGEDFATLARDFSEGTEAGKGGDKGWVAQGLIDARLLKAIFETPVGQVTQIVDIKDARRLPVQGRRGADPDAGRGPARRRSRRGAFQNWYGEKKDAVTITRELLTDLQRELAAGRCSTRSSPRRGSAGGSTSRRASRSSPRSGWSPPRSSRRGRR